MPMETLNLWCSSSMEQQKAEIYITDFLIGFAVRKSVSNLEKMRKRAMKQMFRKVSKVSLVLFIVTLLLTVGIGLLGKENAQILSVLFGAVILLAIVVGICILIAWILNLAEGTKKERISTLKSYVRDMIILIILFALYDWFVKDHRIGWVKLILQSACIACASQAATYIYSKK